jgi:hypothetical protein
MPGDSPYCIQEAYPASRLPREAFREVFYVYHRPMRWTKPGAFKFDSTATLPNGSGFKRQSADVVAKENDPFVRVLALARRQHPSFQQAGR